MWRRVSHSKDLDAIEVGVKWNKFYELVQLEKEKNSRVVGRLEANHGRELELREAGEEAAQGNIEGGKTKGKKSWKTHFGKVGERV